MPRQDAALCQSHSVRRGFALSGFIALSSRSALDGRSHDEVIRQRPDMTPVWCEQSA
ncbi:hypothetical protein SCOCK_290072 [Actinacidiphila cocklensis]|uniref:Uncharacterized protein n=1 Tax=Actinacidiphila cocklensis TaxID=887465 RepID=A0A9W4E7C9_9ACTN|nr:hypothetical protein SCOCK_290072 [Actinacidiphila cocklensis]